jgi:CDP-diacylglycerol--glycerol-3-phosphate 3-phosphatidyltransferase
LKFGFLNFRSANLSDTYFDNRQDRYVIIEDSAFADFVQETVETVGKFSSQGSNARKLNEKDSRNLREELLQLSKPQSSANTAQFEDDDVLLFPAFQLGAIGLRQEELITKSLLSLKDSNSHLFIASGYMNFAKEYMELLSQQTGQLSVVAAGMTSNGFFGAKGAKALVPKLYHQLNVSALDSIPFNARVLEFNRPGWSYHQKGIWLSDTRNGGPFFSSVGSSNFGKHFHIAFTLNSQDGLFRSSFAKQRS